MFKINTCVCKIYIFIWFIWLKLAYFSPASSSSFPAPPLNKKTCPPLMVQVIITPQALRTAAPFKVERENFMLAYLNINAYIYFFLIYRHLSLQLMYLANFIILLATLLVMSYFCITKHIKPITNMKLAR